MKKKVKTSIVVDRELWKRFRERVGRERGLRTLSQAVEEAVEDVACEDLLINSLKEILNSEEQSLTVTPVRPKVATDVGKAVRELRESRI
jgi:hypothetical protein